MNLGTVEAEGRQEQLPRTLGAWGVWLLVVNGMIGAGIFGLPSGAVAAAGAFSPMVYVLCALLILPVLLCFAELASYFRSTGGPIRYATEAFGPFLGFQAGWLFYVARAIAFAANSVLLVDSIGYFWPAAATGGARIVLLALVCGGLTLVNVVGAVRAIRSLAVLTVLKFAVLVGVVVVGLAMLGGDIFRPVSLVPPAGIDLGAAILLLIYAFVGFESAVVPAGEARNPQRDMPRGLLLGLLAVAVLYVMVQVVSLAAVPGIGTSSTPLLDVAAVLLGPVGAGLLMLGVVASVGANLVGTTFATPRVSYSLALDGSLPGWFGRVHPTFLTPANSILAYGAISFVMAVFGSFVWLAASSVVSRLLLYTLTCAAVPLLRPRYRDSGGFVLPLGHLLPLLGIVACAWLMLQVSQKSAVLTASFLVIGSALYWLARRRGRGSARATHD
ncbi:MAG: APC family permease [Pseudomonadota bacterium]